MSSVFPKINSGVGYGPQELTNRNLRESALNEKAGVPVNVWTRKRYFQTLTSNCNSEPALCHRTCFGCKVTSVLVGVFGFLGPLTGSDRGQTHCRVYLKKHHLAPVNGPHLAWGPPVHTLPCPPPPPHYLRHSWSIPSLFP